MAVHEILKMGDARLLRVAQPVLAFDTAELHTLVADITYIRTRSGWLYLAVVLDLFARKVVGWAMAPDMQAGLVCRALQLAIVQRKPAADLIVHTDRGSQPGLNWSSQHCFARPSVAVH